MTLAHANLKAVVDLVEGLPFSDMASWLERALRGQEALPRSTPDEPADFPISRVAMELNGPARKALATAATSLVQRLQGSSNADDSYVIALLGLVRELDLRDAITPLATLALAERFDELPSGQQTAVLSTLIDLRAPLSRASWERIAKEGRHGVLALTALLRGGPDGVTLLPSLRGWEGVADAVYEVLSQHARQLDFGDRRRLVERARALVEQCEPEIGGAVRDWLSEQDSPSDDQSLKAALRRFHDQRGSPCVFEPASARLAA